MTESAPSGHHPDDGDNTLDRLAEATTAMMGRFTKGWLTFALAEGPADIADRLRAKQAEYSARLAGIKADMGAANARVDAADTMAKMATVAILIDPDRDGTYDRDAALSRLLSDHGSFLIEMFGIGPDSEDHEIGSYGDWLARVLLGAQGVAEGYVRHGGENLIDSTGLPEATS